MRRATLPAVVAIGAAWIALAGCDDPLRRQPSIMPHDPPLPGVPAGAVPMEDPEPAADAERAAALANPIPDTPGERSAGGVLYGRFCRHCHGSLGRGFTSVGSSLDPAPADLVTQLNRSDGELFGIITFGGRASPALGPHIPVPDRWRIIRYLRTLPDARRAQPEGSPGGPWGQ